MEKKTLNDLLSMTYPFKSDVFVTEKELFGIFNNKNIKRINDIKEKIKKIKKNVLCKEY